MFTFLLLVEGYKVYVLKCQKKRLTQRSSQLTVWRTGSVIHSNTFRITQQPYHLKNDAFCSEQACLLHDRQTQKIWAIAVRPVIPRIIVTNLKSLYCKNSNICRRFFLILSALKYTPVCSQSLYWTNSSLNSPVVLTFQSPLLTRRH